MALRTKRERAHQFYRLLPDTSAPSPINPVAASQFKAKVTYKKSARPPRTYVPMTMLELLEWQFMCWRPELDAPRLLTRNGVV